MRNSFASYQPVRATDKWVPKADRELMEKEQMLIERERQMERMLRREIPVS